jgi:hypothetical protein
VVGEIRLSFGYGMALRDSDDRVVRAMTDWLMGGRHNGF